MTLIHQTVFCKPVMTNLWNSSLEICEFIHYQHLSHFGVHLLNNGVSGINVVKTGFIRKPRWWQWKRRRIRVRRNVFSLSHGGRGAVTCQDLLYILTLWKNIRSPGLHQTCLSHFWCPQYLWEVLILSQPPWVVFNYLYICRNSNLCLVEPNLLQQI